jgi:hypothetical protein
VVLTLSVLPGHRVLEVCDLVLTGRTPP